MADTRDGREKGADDAERRQREREMAEARAHADEAEPADDERDGSPSTRECHRRGCTEPATFLALERYLEETGHGAVEAEAVLCRAHAAEESPANLDDAYADYVFRVEPLPGTQPPDTGTDAS